MIVKSHLHQPINIYINGSSGFIGSGLINKLKLQDHYLRNSRNDNVYRIRIFQMPRELPNDFIFPDGRSIFIQNASPSDMEDFKNIKETNISMIDQPLKNIKMIMNQSEKKQIYFIFMSSIGATIQDSNKFQNNYNLNKKCLEEYLMDKDIKDRLKSCIFRVPRVYSPKRNKGLIKKIKDNKIPDSDLNNKVEFMELNNFLKEVELNIISIITDPDRNLHHVFEFKNNLKIKSIKEIKDAYKF